MSEPLAYTPAQAAIAGAISRTRVDRAISAGRLPAVDIAKRGAERHAYRITRDALVAWIAAGYPEDPVP